MSYNSSYIVQVIADSSGQWYGNSMVYATREEAENAAKDLFRRWTSVREWRVVESDKPVNTPGEKPNDQAKET